MKRKYFILIFAIAFMLLFNSRVYAASDIISDAQSFISQGEEELSTGEALDEANMVEGVQKLLNIAIDIGYAIAIAYGIYLGFKLMTSSAQDKAGAKETLVAYVVGCFVTFGAVTIWRIVVNLFM